MPLPVVKIEIATEGLGKGVEKVVELAKSAGVLLFGPGHTVRMARARAEAMQIEAEAEVQVHTIEQRAFYRLGREAIREQENLEAVYEEATKQLPPAAEVSSEPVSEDWTAKFNDRARFASDEELRKLWARILAREVARPGAVSTRAIVIVDQMTPADARALEQILSRAFATSSDQTLIVPRISADSSDGDDKELFGVDYQTFENLRSAGLIAPSNESMLRSSKLTPGQFPLKRGHDVFVISSTKAGGAAALPVYLLTEPCRQIAHALRVAVNELFLEQFCEWATRHELSVACLRIQGLQR